MPKARRCGHCGNEIPSWSGRVCPVCGRISQSAKRFWKGGRKRRRPRARPAQREAARRSPVEYVGPPQPEPVTLARWRKASKATRSLGWRSRGRRRLDGFNRLLRDVYGRSVWLSHLLAKHGVSRAQVNRWRRDGLWLVRFLKRLRSSLLIELAEVIPGQGPQILSLWYGLDGQGARSVEVIADELGMETREVLGARLDALRYLWNKDGRAALERTVLAAAEETQQSYERKGLQKSADQ
jgi:hypothetical protein